jgi:hypothetical protein
MRDLTLKGNTPEQKLKHAETILNRLARRTKKSVAVLMPPCPISMYRDDIPGIGAFFTFLSAIEGKIKTLCLEVQCTKFKGAKISLAIERKGAAPGASFSVGSGIGIYDTDIDVKVGDKIIFYLLEMDRAADEVGSISVAVGFSITPVRQAAEAEALAIDSLKETADEIVSN